MKGHVITGVFNYSRDAKVIKRQRKMMKDGESQTKDGKKTEECHACGHIKLNRNT